MNSRKKLIAPGMAFVFILMQHLCPAQSFQYTAPNFNITLPSLSEWNSNTSSPPLGYSLFIETGNGRYIKIPGPLYGAYTNPPYGIGYNYAIPGQGTPSNPGAVLNIIGHYDTIKPPRGLYAMPFISNTAVDAPPAQNKLPPGSHIRFDFSDSSAVIGDTMTLVITYKPDSVTNYVVALFYNETNTLGNPFVKISDPGQTYPFADGTANRIRYTKAIRTWYGESAYTTTDPLSSQVKSVLPSIQGNFKNAVYFVLPPGATAEEKNIFISLVTPLQPALLGSVANIKASLIRYNAVQATSHEEVSLGLPIGQFASDPNGIKTTPHCLNEVPGGPYNKPVQYAITFQNKGNGPAKNVEVKVHIPEGIQLPVSGSFDVISYVGLKRITFVPEGSQAGILAKTPNTYKIKNSGGERSITFTFKGINLLGNYDVAKSHGTIHFTLNTLSRKNSGINGPREIPACMYSDLSIIFTSIIGGIEKQEQAVTGYDLVRSSCSYTSPSTVAPPCPRQATAILPPKTQ